MREVDVREFRMEDGAAVRAFWEASGIRIRPGDDDRSLAAFADRNPALFLLALDEQGLAATALGGWDGHVGGGYRWVGDRDADIQNQTRTHLDSYGAFDLNADVSNVNWTIRAYLKNATDKRAYLNKADINDLLGVTDRISAVPIQPRTFGVEVDYKF